MKLPPGSNAGSERAQVLWESVIAGEVNAYEVASKEIGAAAAERHSHAVLNDQLIAGSSVTGCRNIPVRLFVPGRPASIQQPVSPLATEDGGAAVRTTLLMFLDSILPGESN
jgi:hypothetical protein